MSDQQRHADEALLIDFVLGRCSEAEAEQIRRRLEREADLAALHQDVRNTRAVVRLLPQVEPPENLAVRTVARIRQAKATDALIARQESGRVSILRPTFSIRELGAVAAAALLMAVVFLPSVQEARKRSNIVRCAAQQGQIGTALLNYANENGGSLPSTSAPNNRWLATDGEAVASNSSGLFKLVNANYANPVTFQCPSSSGGQAANFAVQAGMMDFPADKFINYSYQHTVGHGLSMNDPAIQPHASQMAIMADANPLFRQGRFQPARLRASGSDNHDGAGQNVLYLDMHAQWADHPTVGVAGNNIFLAEGIYDYRGDETPVGPTDTFLLPAYSGR
jgi:hypothetical protein